MWAGKLQPPVGEFCFRVASKAPGVCTALGTEIPPAPADDVLLGFPAPGEEAGRLPADVGRAFLRPALPPALAPATAISMAAPASSSPSASRTLSLK